MNCWLLVQGILSKKERRCSRLHPPRMSIWQHHTATLSAKSLRIMKRWYAAHFLALADDVGPTGPRSSAPGQQEDAAREAGSQHPPSLPPPRNINTTAALYGLACVLELPADSGGYEPGEERERLVRCAGEWGEWVMDELPSEWAAPVDLEVCGPHG